MSVTYVIPQITAAATGGMANAWFPIPITSRAVKVMGRKFTNCPLDEQDILGHVIVDPAQ